MPKEEKLRLAGEHGRELNITPFEVENPHLLHGKLGVYVSRTEFGIEDPDILNAVANHTKGRPGMSLLEKIVFTADFIEPDRDKNHISCMPEIRKAAFEDMDLCVYLLAKRTLEYLNASGRPVDQDSVKTYEYYKELAIKGGKI